MEERDEDYSGTTFDTDSIASEQSAYSVTTALQRSDLRKHGLWLSKTEQIIVTMAPNLSLLDYSSYVIPDRKEAGTSAQIFMMYILVGIPASYMQMVLGQYSHLGVFLIKRMVPIADGLGFSYALTIFVFCVFALCEMQMLCLYVILTLIPGPLQWSVCKTGNCWGPWTPCKSPEGCVNETVFIAAFVYWDKTFMQGAQRHIRLPDPESAVVAMFTWVIIYLLTSLSIQKLKRLIRFTATVHLICKGIMAFSIMIVANPWIAITNMAMLSLTNFFEFSAWRDATVRVVITMTLGDFFYVTMGSLTSDNVRIGIISFLSGILSFVSLFLDDIIIHTGIITLQELANVPLEKRKLLLGPVTSVSYLILLPTIFEILPLPRVWNFVYFTNKIVAILLRVISNILFLHDAMSHRFPTLASYRKYISPLFCVCGWTMGIFFTHRDTFPIAVNFKNINNNFCQYFNVFFFACMVSYVYGVRQFCDDVHFLRGSAPNLFWKIVWMIFPIFLAATFDFSYIDPANPYIFECLVEVFILFSPYIFLTGAEIIRKIIQRKTIELITPEFRWGPKEPDRRLKRKVFHPRKNTKYMIEGLECKHSCLQKNKVLLKLISKEREIIARLEGGRGKFGRY